MCEEDELSCVKTSFLNEEDRLSLVRGKGCLYEEDRVFLSQTVILLCEEDHSLSDEDSLACVKKMGLPGPAGTHTACEALVEKSGDVKDPGHKQDLSCLPKELMALLPHSCYPGCGPCECSPADLDGI
ncbi:hypothetical protein H920_04582 [Fukomys damarensis]|uniref:Uncharacterized protein n=1 Tax=Fukomys damarensis TaxID=885580 RepID=A0A091EEX8_FUKDA|nr:hypothetical protein H920_04582 [Fukomys damarensis]